MINLGEDLENQPAPASPVLKAQPVEQGGVMCEICYSNYLDKDMHGLSSCSHKFCLNCITDYLEYNISNG